MDIHNEELGYMMWRLTNNWQKLMKQKLQEVDLTHVQFALLRSCHSINERGGSAGATQVQIAHESYMDPMMASEVLRTLEKKGYVNRVPHPQDTRAKLIRLTEPGENVMERANQIVLEADKTFFSKLGPELEGFIKQLRLLIG
ncbi:MarR family winged helix-turn-helix transcriptional regulator [Paenibacillus sp. 22594]|uniref:MarR family winged helix-turn-helix transcriptional regulator n=1 Tax=Paenibacillus sp. 22594 TaxID=3453947 RepID=UPI003F86DF9E